MSKVRTKDGFTYVMTKEELEEGYYGGVADVLGKPKPKDMWEALLSAPVLDEDERKQYLARHCECPLVKELIQNSMKEGE